MHESLAMGVLAQPAYELPLRQDFVHDADVREDFESARVDARGAAGGHDPRELVDDAQGGSVPRQLAGHRQAGGGGSVDSTCGGLGARRAKVGAMGSRRASRADREHFRRIAEASGPLPEDAPPRSLDELFERLDAIRRTLGSAAEPGASGADEAELEAHLRVLRRGREIRAGGA